jgi:hypothetical protein
MKKIIKIKIGGENGFATERSLRQRKLYWRFQWFFVESIGIPNTIWFYHFLSSNQLTEVYIVL